MVFTRSQTKAIYDTYFDAIKTDHEEYANGKWRKNNVFLNNTKCVNIFQVNSTISEQLQIESILYKTREIAEKAYEDFYGDGMRVKLGFNGPIVAISYHYD